MTVVCSSKVHQEPKASLGPPTVFMACLSKNEQMCNCFLLLFSSSLDSLRCHPEDQKPDPDVIPSNSTLKTLMYDSSFAVTLSNLLGRTFILSNKINVNAI